MEFGQETGKWNQSLETKDIMQARRRDEFRHARCGTPVKGMQARCVEAREVAEVGRRLSSMGPFRCMRLPYVGAQETQQFGRLQDSHRGLRF